MAGKITGRVEILVNGEMLLNKPGAKASGIGVSGEPAVERKEVMGDTGIQGFIEEPIVAMCEVTITDREDMSLDRLARINGDGTVIFRARGGGKAYVMEGATCKANFDLTAGEGETTVKFVGAYWTEMTQ